MSSLLSLKETFLTFLILSLVFALLQRHKAQKAMERISPENLGHLLRYNRNKTTLALIYLCVFKELPAEYKTKWRGLFEVWVFQILFLKLLWIAVGALHIEWQRRASPRPELTQGSAQMKRCSPMEGICKLNCIC